jgi:two-component system, LytTR family, response regulator LytT
MNAIIIEDEPLAAERLQELLREIDPSLRIEAHCQSIEASVTWLKTGTPDLIFLDVQLSDGLSFAIFDEVQVDAPIIFTTAYDEYALKAFKLNSIDYLLKPVRKDELRAALEKFRKGSARRTVDIATLLRSLPGGSAPAKKRFLIQFGDRIKHVETDDVAYFFALDKTVFLVTKQGQKYPLSLTLDAIEEMVDAQAFFRINRRMIISFHSIRQMVPFTRSRIRIDLQPSEPPEVEAIVSVERTASFKRWLDQ